MDCIYFYTLGWESFNDFRRQFLVMYRFVYPSHSIEYFEFDCFGIDISKYWQSDFAVKYTNFSNCIKEMYIKQVIF